MVVVVVVVRRGMVLPIDDHHHAEWTPKTQKVNHVHRAEDVQEVS
jgi:hypothetical protein